jgi:hypothetical protein
LNNGLFSQAPILTSRNEARAFSQKSGSANFISSALFVVDNASLASVMNEDDAEQAGVLQKQPVSKNEETST